MAGGDTPVGPAVALALLDAAADAHAEALPATPEDERSREGRPERERPDHESMLQRHRLGAARAVSVLVVLLVVLVPVLQRAPLQAGPARPDHLGLVVVVAGDQAVPPGFVEAVQHEAALAVDWIQQKSGRSFRGSVVEAEIIRLPVDQAQLRGSTTAAYRSIVAEVRRQQRRRTLFPVAVTPASTLTPQSNIQPCARGGATGMVVFIGNCGDGPSSEAVWGSPVSRRIAHELVHGLGAVADCAPNGTTSGHVLDDPADILYGGLEQIDPLTTAITLDADRDDYFAHGNEGCPDILDSPLWR